MNTSEKTNPLTLKDINERLKHFSDQQAALLTDTTFSEKDKEDLQKYYQAKSTEYKILQDEAIKNQEVKDPIIVFN